MNKSQILSKALIFSYLEAKQLVILNKLSDLKLANYKSLYEEFLSNSDKNSDKKFLTNSDKNSDKNSDQKPSAVLSKIQLIIVNGSYASGKLRFAENLLRFQQEFPYKFHVFSIKPYEIPSLTEEKFLIKLVDFAVLHKISAQNELIILVQPSRLRTEVLVDLFEKNMDFSQKFTVKCVVTKINANNIHENAHKQFVEKLLAFAIEGFSQFLILDAYGNTEVQIDQWNSLIKSALPQANLYRVLNNIVSLGVMEDIMKYEGFCEKKTRFQRLKNSHFS